MTNSSTEKDNLFRASLVSFHSAIIGAYIMVIAIGAGTWVSGLIVASNAAMAIFWINRIRMASN